MINFLLNPMAWFAIGFFIFWKYRLKLSLAKRRICIIFSLFAFYLLTTPFFPYLLIRQLEDSFEPLSLSKLDTLRFYHIIVLGAGHGYDDRLPANSLLELAALGRLCEGIRIINHLPKSRLITSGFSASHRTPQAIVLKQAAILLGVDSTRIFAQTEPSNTSEESQFYYQRFGKDTTLIVATSAVHMPRAMMLFEKRGVKAIAAPTNYIIKRQNPISWHAFIPNMQYFGIMQQTLHEYVGYIKDWFVG